MFQIRISFINVPTPTTFNFADDDLRREFFIRLRTPMRLKEIFMDDVTVIDMKQVRMIELL